MRAGKHYFRGPDRRMLVDTLTRAIPLFFMMAAITATSALAQFREAAQLTSNNIIALAGNGDTLWLATERGFNYRTSTNTQGGWPGFEVNDMAHRFWGLAFGGGRAAAIMNNSDNTSPDYIGFWQFNHISGRQEQKFFRFPNDIRGENGDLADPAGGMAYSHGSFWAPFNNGGIVRYDPNSNSVHAIRPGDNNEASPQNIGPLGSNDDEKNARIVLSLDASQSGNSILVTTPSTLWSYYPGNNNKWDTLHTSPTLAPAGNEEFVSFDAAFTVNKKGAPALYSFITVKRGDEKHSLLYGYDDDSKQWFKALDTRDRFSLFPAAGGSVYALFEDNRVILYADTAGNGAGRENSLSTILEPGDFRTMLAKAGDAPNPEVNYILFIPRDGDEGALAVATTTGLYVCESANPLSGSYNDFMLTRYVREVKAGQAYALPGVIRASYDGRHDKCTFVYKLKKDGDVTIRVYDYNMSLVKTVIKGARRGSKTQRSTDPARDVWDGKNDAGKHVWPGVYYFKITSTGGDRFFGKVILAK